MIVIPFGSGVVAAFIFLIFEIIVFPLLFYSTSKLASLHLYWTARKGKNVVVDEMSFPLWSEGLSRRHASHVALLAVRIVLLAIPVYLETTLTARDDFEMVTRTFSNAFLPEPTTDWLSYQTRSEKDIGLLRSAALKLFFACAFMDEQGWVWAKMANVTFLENGREQIRCHTGTERQIYRLPDRIFGFTREQVFEYVSINVAWTEGRLEHFPQALVVEGFGGKTSASNETAFRVNSITVLNDTAVECYVPDSVRTRYFIGVNHRRNVTEWRGWCQRDEPEGVAFYIIRFEMDELPMLNRSTADASARATCDGSSCQFWRRNATTVVRIIYRGSLQFKGKTLLGAEHLASFKPDWSDSDTLSNMARSVLYTMVRNVSVTVPSGRKLPRTEVETEFIIIGFSEVVIVLLFTLMLTAVWRWKWSYVQEPNTIDGLSRCWADAEQNSSHQWKQGGKWINLTLERNGSEGDGSLRFMPSGTERRNQTDHYEEEYSDDQNHDSYLV